MKPSVFVSGCTVALVLLAGCASQDADTEDTTATETTSEDTGDAAQTTEPAEEQPDADGDHIRFGESDAGDISSVSCQTDGGVTTITIAAAQDTTVVVTDEDPPAVRTVSIGEAGSDGPSLIFLEGVSPAPEAARDGNRYTVSGTGMGTGSADPNNPAEPVEMPFDIAVTCP